MCQNTASLQRCGETEPPHFLAKGRSLDLPWLVKALGLFAPWANCVYYHTFLVSVQSTAAKQAGRLSKPLFPGEKSCHLLMCHFRLPALSHLLAHFAWAGEICATCHCLPACPWDWWNTFWEKVMVPDKVFTSFCVEKKGRWPLINTVFARQAERDRADSISESLPFCHSSAAVNKQEAEKYLLYFHFWLHSWHVVTNHHENNNY